MIPKEGEHLFFKLVGHKRMRILVITWKAVTESWVQQGHSVDVICACASSEDDRSAIIDKIKVHFVKDPLAKPSHQKQKKKTLISKMLRLFNAIVRWPDFTWLWLPRAYLKTKTILEQNCFDAIYSVGLPLSPHLIAYRLHARLHNKQWVCDIGDPFSFTDTPSNNPYLYKIINKIAEKKIIKASKKIVVTTSPTVCEYESKLKVSKAWFLVVPPITTKKKFDNPHTPSSLTAVRASKEPEKFKFSSGAFKQEKKLLERDGAGFAGESDALQSDINKDKKIVRLVYAGTLYAKIRNPSELLIALSQFANYSDLVDIQAHFYSNLNDCSGILKNLEKNLGDWFYLHEPVAQSELELIYKKADILINIGNTSTYQLPSKIVEYMSYGKPILNYVRHKQDISSELLKNYPQAHQLYLGNQRENWSEARMQALETFLLKANDVDERLVHSLLNEYYPESASEKYIKIISPDYRAERIDTIIT